MQNILDLMMSNPIYIGVAGLIGLFLILSLLKKLFKLAMIIIFVVLAYGGYLYMTEDNPVEVIQAKLDKGKSTINELDKATKDIRGDALEKVMDDVDKKMKKAAKKK